jgi:hypothetical protein
VGRRGDAVRGNVGRSLRGIDNPAPRGNQRAKKARKVTNLKEVAPVSRESGCVQHVLCPEAPAARSACGRVEKAREGLDAQLLECIRRAGQETSEGQNPKGASGAVFG